MRNKIFLSLIIVFALGFAATYAVIRWLVDSSRENVYLDTNFYLIIFALFFFVIAAAACFVIRYIIERTVIKGIQETLDVLRRVSEGELNITANVRSCEEFEELSNGINFMLDSINNKIDKITKLSEDLRSAKEQAEYINRKKSAFFSSVSHEIRTPMNVIIGMSELLAEDKLSASQLDKVYVMQTYSGILLGIIDDLLDFSKIDEGTFTLSPVHYNLQTLLNHVIKPASLSAREKGLEFISEISGNLPQYLYGDAVKLRQALNNLLSNAVKFTDKGSVTLTVRVGDENRLLFAVRDTGKGIKPEDAERLFDTFGQIEARRERGLSGMGLGLSITDSIIRMMNGKITVESIYEYGSTFRFEIPFELGNEAFAEHDADESTYVSAPKAKILLVDDIDINLTVGIGFFKLNDINADVAAGGREAIKKVCEKDYDIVFMDHMMPDVDGVRATEIIRKFGGKYAKNTDTENPRETENLKIIALTANVTPEARDMMLEAGMDDYLPKPVTAAELGRMLMKWLPEKKREIKLRKAYEDLQPEDYTPVLKAAQSIEGLNLKLGLRRSGNTAEAFEKALRLLYRRIPKSMLALEICLAEKRFPAFAIEAHGMKGALAIIGLEELSKEAAELEFAAKDEYGETLKEKLPKFTKKMSEIAVKIEDILSQDVPSEKKEGSAEILEGFIKNLTTDIERFDRKRALKEADAALEYDYGGNGDINRLIESVRADLEDFDYDSAMEKLQAYNTEENS